MPQPPLLFQEGRLPHERTRQVNRFMCVSNSAEARVLRRLMDIVLRKRTRTEEGVNEQQT